MTPERARDLLPIIQAFANGEAIQRRGAVDREWRDCTDARFDDGIEYRVAPLTERASYKTPWTLKTAPLPSALLLRNVHEPACTYTPSGWGPDGVFISFPGSNRLVTWSMLCDHWLFAFYKPGRTLVWSPCDLENL